MCGRYRLSRRKQIVEEYFDSDSGAKKIGHGLIKPNALAELS
jgi:hypothetical protein